jgi:hypothetical protein
MAIVIKFKKVERPDGNEIHLVPQGGDFELYLAEDCVVIDKKHKSFARRVLKLLWAATKIVMTAIVMLVAIFVKTLAG